MLIDDKLYLATLADLPTIIEAQKTLDYRTFFKAADVSQVLYIHNRVLDAFKSRTAQEVFDFAEAFKPQEDPDFLATLYKRSQVQKAEEVGPEHLRLRHGLAPPTKNVRNVRYKKEPSEDPAEVHAVEKILKDIIDVRLISVTLCSMASQITWKRSCSSSMPRAS